MQHKVVLGYSVRPTSTGHETEFPGLVLGPELTNAVVRPAVDLDAIVEDDYGLTVELDDTAASEVAHIGVGKGLEFCEGGGGGRKNQLTVAQCPKLYEYLIATKL